MASRKWDARNNISLVVHNGNVLLYLNVKYHVIGPISFSLCDWTDLILHLGLHNRSMGPVTGVTVRPCVFVEIVYVFCCDFCLEKIRKYFCFYFYLNSFLKSYFYFLLKYFCLQTTFTFTQVVLRAFTFTFTQVPKKVTRLNTGYNAVRKHASQRPRYNES